MIGPGNYAEQFIVPRREPSKIILLDGHSIKLSLLGLVAKAMNVSFLSSILSILQVFETFVPTFVLSTSNHAGQSDIGDF